MFHTSEIDLYGISERLCTLSILLKAYHVRLFETEFRYASKGHPKPVHEDAATIVVRNHSRERYNYLRQRATLPPVTDWAIDPQDH